MTELEGFFEGQPDKWNSFCLFHTELQERLSDLWQAGLTLSSVGQIINVDEQGSIRIGKLPNPFKTDTTPDTVKDLPTWTQHGLLLAWSTINDLPHDHMAAILISRGIPSQFQADLFARNLVTLFRHNNPQTMTKEMFSPL